MDENEYSQAGKSIRDMMRVSAAKAWGRGIIGAILGAVIGYFAYFKLLDFGYDGLMVSGLLIGLGFSLFSKRTFWSAGIFCAVLALIVMLYCEWQSLENFHDKDLATFVKAIPDLNSWSKIMLGVGALMAFWLGRGK